VSKTHPPKSWLDCIVECILGTMAKKRRNNNHPRPVDAKKRGPSATEEPTATSAGTLEEESDRVSLPKVVGTLEKPMEIVQLKEREEISLSSADGSAYSKGELSAQ